MTDENIKKFDLPKIKETTNWFWNCKVVMAGPADDLNIYVYLRDVEAGLNGWYKANPSIKHEILSVALSALTNGKLCQACLTDKTEYSQINRFYIKDY